jgi:hypothetical protein
MKNYKLSITSLILSAGSIIALFLINREIAVKYLSADGKTRVWFDLVEYLSFSYKYYFLISAVSSLVVVIFAIRKKEIKWLAYMALIISVFSIASVFIQFWKLLI